MSTGYRSPNVGRGRKRTSPRLDGLAEDWLTAKRALESAAQADKGNSDRARRGDLARWAELLAGVVGRVERGSTPTRCSGDCRRRTSRRRP